MIACSVPLGTILVFFGVLLLLENLGVSDKLVGRYWPVALIILGLASVFNISRRRLRFGRLRRRWPPNVDE